MVFHVIFKLSFNLSDIHGKPPIKFKLTASIIMGNKELLIQVKNNFESEH